MVRSSVGRMWSVRVGRKVVVVMGEHRARRAQRVDECAIPVAAPCPT